MKLEDIMSAVALYINVPIIYRFLHNYKLILIKFNFFAEFLLVNPSVRCAHASGVTFVQITF